MNRKLSVKNKIVLCLILFAVLLTSLSFSIGKVGEGYADLSVNFVSERVNAKYTLNQKFTIPQAKILFNGQEYSATRSALEYPDGKVYSQAQYELTQSGKYVVRYYATVNSFNISGKVSFVVSDKLFDVTGSNSSAVYGKDTRGDKDGIIVSLSPGEEFVFNKPINLNDNTKTDKLIQLYATPNSQGVEDAKLLRIRFTDVCDATNFVDVVTVHNAWHTEVEYNSAIGGNYIWSHYTGAAASNGQQLAGLYWRDAQTSTGDYYKCIRYDNSWYTIWYGINVNQDMGYPSSEFSFVARDGYGENMYNLSMDYNERQLFGGKAHVPDSNGMIIDLDEPLFYRDLWQGFTTGYAAVSISADAYTSSDFNFVITNIDGEDLSDINYYDTDKPNVFIEKPDRQIPNAIVGKPYKLFPATAFDGVDGQIDYETMVFRGYDTNAPVQFDVKDGAFIPTISGNYDVVYRAVDASGNVAIERVVVQALKQSELNVQVENIEQLTYLTGQEIILPKATVQGAQGEIEQKVTATLVDKNVVYECVKNNDGNFVFLPLYAGKYDIVFSVSDYNEVKEICYQITVSANSQPVILNEVSFPEVVIKGASYDFPELVGYELNSGEPKEVKAKITYSFDNGADIEYLGGKVKVVGAEKLTVNYKIGNYSKQYAIKVVDTGYGTYNLDMSKYFYGENFTVTKNSDNVAFTLNSDGVIKYVREVLVSNFDLQMNVSSANFNKITLKLKDAINESESLTAVIEVQDENYVKISVNGSAPELVSGGLTGDLRFVYSNGNNYIKINNSTYKFEGFDGFSSYKAFVELSIEDVYGESVLKISKINNQFFSRQKFDDTQAEYYYDITTGNMIVGDEIVISRFIVNDMLHDIKEFSVTIKDAKGNICTATDGTTLKDLNRVDKEYRVIAQSIGTYTITAVYADDMNNRNVLNINVSVKDGVAPQIVLGKYSQTAKVGKNVEVASCTVTDDNDTDLKVFIVVCLPSGNVETLKENTFKPETKGIYTIMYYVTDKAGNLGFISYEVVVD